MNLKVSFLIIVTGLFVTPNSFAQNEAEVTYIHHNLGFKQPSTLFITNTAFLFQKHQENDKRIDENNYEYFLHKDYFNWYYNRAKKLYKCQ